MVSYQQVWKQFTILTAVLPGAHWLSITSRSKACFPRTVGRMAKVESRDMITCNYAAVDSHLGRGLSSPRTSHPGQEASSVRAFHFSPLQTIQGLGPNGKGQTSRSDG